MHPTDIKVKEQEHPNYIPYEIYEKAILENSQLTNRIEYLEGVIKEKDEVIANGMKVEFNTASLLQSSSSASEAVTGNTNEAIAEFTKYVIEPDDDIKIWRLLARSHKRNFIMVPNPSIRTTLWLADFGQEQ